MKMKKAFTLIELVVAVAILAMVMSFAGVIFKVSIAAYRTATANTEIMQKLRAITDQLNRDFKGLQKDGYLILHSEEITRREFANSLSPDIFRADRLYYFSAGDFQSWFDPGIRSNIARVYFGHDRASLDDVVGVVVSKWNLARDVMLLTPGYSSVDCNTISYAECKAQIPLVLNWANELLSFSVPIDIRIDPDDVRRLMCQNAGQIVIEWTDGTKYPAPNNSLAWFGFDMPRTVVHPDIPADPAYEDIEYTLDLPIYYRAFWTPVTPKQLWPKALKFTFTLYDSKGTLKGGRTFTYIVYIGD
jgi:prepilin-type N-terminal cleavage/methylation domain-containing protein